MKPETMGGRLRLIQLIQTKPEEEESKEKRLSKLDMLDIQGFCSDFSHNTWALRALLQSADMDEFSESWAEMSRVLKG